MTSITSGRQRATLFGSLTNAQTVAGVTGIFSSPLYCNFMLCLPGFRVANRAPYFVPVDRHVDVPDTKRRQPVDNGIHQYRRPPDVGTLAHPLYAHRAKRAR